MADHENLQAAGLFVLIWLGAVLGVLAAPAIPYPTNAYLAILGNFIVLGVAGWYFLFFKKAFIGQTSQVRHPETMSEVKGSLEELINDEVTTLVKVGDSEIRLVKGNIQETTGLGRECAIMLPANTTFMDDCITDKNSALGAYFLENYPGRNEEALSAMQKELEARGYSRNHEGDYPPGATIMMPAPFDSPVKLIISGTTVRHREEGINAEPSSIAEAIRKAFALTADMKVSRLRMPILGSGHGGMSLADAINLIVYTTKHYIGKHHHVKLVELVVREADASKLRLINAGRHVVVVEGSET